MKAHFENVYPKVQKDKNGNPVLDNKGNRIVNDIFVYHVYGTEAEIEAYKDAQGSNYRETDSGRPLFFSLQYAGDNVTIIITSNGKVVADTSALKKAASLAKQHEFMAPHIAQTMVAALGIGNMAGNVARTTANPASNGYVQSPTSVEEGTIEGINPF